MSITTVATPGDFTDNLGLLRLPDTCRGYFELGGSQGGSVVDLMGGPPMTITGPVDYYPAYADFRGGSEWIAPFISQARNRMVLLVGSSNVDEKVLDGGQIVWPPMSGPAEMRYPPGAQTLKWNNGAQFLVVHDGGFFRSESGDLAANFMQVSNNPIAYTDGTISPNLWGAGIIAGPTQSVLLNPQGQGVLPLMQAFSGTPAADSATRGGNADGPPSSHHYLSSIAHFDAGSISDAMLYLDFMMRRASRRLGYRIARSDLDAAA
jgi:hypothetical protein